MFSERSNYSRLMADAFPMPSIAEFRAMSADDFERFWRLYAASFTLSPADLERSIALKRAGWEVQTVSFNPISLWRWDWISPPQRPKIVVEHMMEAYRTMMIDTTGVDPDRPTVGTPDGR